MTVKNNRSYPTFIITQEPRQTPRKKGPFYSDAMVEEFLREAYRLYPEIICIVVNVPLDNGWYPEHGYEWLDINGDRRRRHPRKDRPTPSVTVKARKAKLPPVGNELYEHYPAMSAQTHAEAVEDYARAAVARALSAQVQDVAERAFQAIADERIRQIGKGYDAAHDDRHVAGEIISATWGASARLWDAQECAVSGDIAGYKKYLIQAAAQIVAEYGRVERAAAPAKQEGDSDGR